MKKLITVFAAMLISAVVLSSPAQALTNVSGSYVLDENGKCISADFTDYGVPMIEEAPEDFKAVLIDVNDQYGPFGANSISEIATNGAAPAIANAIYDAVGARVRSWPITPEKILRALGKI